MATETRSIIDRVFEINAAVLTYYDPYDPFGRPHLAWRLSPDVWADIREWCADHQWPVPIIPSNGDRLLTWPVTIDETLPTNAMLLEPQ